MHEPERLNFPFMSITDAFNRLVKIKQKDNASLLDYSKRLKQAKYILEKHVVKDILGHYVENPEEFKNATGSDSMNKINCE